MPSQSTIKGIVDFAGRLKGINVRVLSEGLEIARLHRQVEQVIENELAAWGLTSRQVEIMESLYHNAEGTLTPADLSEEVGLTRSAMTSALDALEKMGHIVRTPHSSDRRMLAISLTASGQEFIRQRLPERYQRLYGIMNGLAESERSLLLRSYRKVIDFLACDLLEDSSKA